MYAERKKRTKLSKEDALNAMQKLCMVQERCHSEIRTRLIEHSVFGDNLEEIISDLISDGFLNEERFAIAYVSGKFKIKKWGKVKILSELKFRKISSYSIKKALAQIDGDEYYTTLYNLLDKKNNNVKASNIWERRKKLTSFATQKGYEYEVIKDVLADLL